VIDPAKGAERATFRGTLNSAKGQSHSFAYAEVSSSVAYRLVGAKGPVLRVNGQARFMDMRTPDVSDAWLSGGSASVRGFDPGAVSGGSGQALQMAVYQALPWKAVDTPEAFVFADQARAVKDDIAQRIASAGFGLQFQIDRKWSVETALTHQTQGFQGPRTRALVRASATW
jgi:hemolysin activation/secretion protein